MQDLLKEHTVALSDGIEPSALVELQAPHGPAILGKRRGRRVCGASVDFVHVFLIQWLYYHCTIQNALDELKTHPCRLSAFVLECMQIQSTVNLC